MNNDLQIYAQAYGSGSYGSSTYNGQVTTTTTSTSGGSSSILVDTGTMVLAFVTIACVIIFVALVVKFWKRSNKKTSDKTPKH